MFLNKPSGSWPFGVCCDGSKGSFGRISDSHLPEGGLIGANGRDGWCRALPWGGLRMKVVGQRIFGGRHD